MVMPILAVLTYDNAKQGERESAHHACRADVPRYHFARLGIQLAGHKIPAERVAAADLARLDRRNRGSPAGRAGAGARPEPARCSSAMATADRGRRAQRDGLDGADGPGAALAACQ